MSRCGGRLPPVPRALKRRDVVRRPGGQNERDRRQHARGKTAPPQDEVDQGSPRAAVAVDEGVDGLELGVRQGCLHNGRQ